MGSCIDNLVQPKTGTTMETRGGVKGFGDDDGVDWVKLLRTKFPVAHAS